MWCCHMSNFHSLINECEKRDKLGRRNTGRPKANGWHRGNTTPVTIRVDKSQIDELKTEAKKRNVTYNELIRTYIEWGLENEE